MDLQTWLTILAGLAGGLGLFLYGMDLLSNGLQKVAGDNLKKILEKLTTNRLVGVGVGALITAAIQSSSVTTVMIVGFVNAGLINLTQALSVVLGANVGTTITAQILAFNITSLALPAIAAGAISVVFIKKDIVQSVGQVILGVGLLFFGLTIMIQSFAPLQNSEMITKLFTNFSKMPVLAVLVGALTTMVIQSSSATIGITIALATNGLVDFPGAIALVLGENIGTTITANIAAIGGSRVAKQAAFGHFLFNVLGVSYMLLLLHPFTMFINYITPGDVYAVSADGTYPNMARHIANTHTMFNIINVLVFIPLLPLLAKLCERIIKTDKKQNYQYTHLADEMLSAPDTAVAQVRQEVMRMADLTMTMLKTTETALQKQTKDKMSAVLNYEDDIDGFKLELMRFLDQLQGRSLSEKALSEMEKLKIAIFNLEEISDLSKSIMKCTAKMLDKKQVLSPIARKELIEMFDAVIFFANRTFSAFSSGQPQPDAELAVEDEIDKMHKQFRKNHVKRLNKGSCQLETGMNFVDIINSLEMIGDHIFAVAQINVYNQDNHMLQKI